MSDYTHLKHSELTAKIIKAAYYVHDYLGFGHVESVYENSMIIQLQKMKLMVNNQVPIKVYFETHLVGNFKADLLVEDDVIIELKSVEKIHPKHEVQLVNYLKSSHVEVGLLINFGEELTFKRKIFDNDRKRGLNRIP